ncbi:peptidylprolyl isomerase [Sphingomonas canadensis]|uniref:Peptidylprolyl isomerase n=1 Tax=Sphingomonas canadensis TaxID=1219257 RepID=A0ABW3H4N7_9SPHN|nr:peptidylprolyl isomerase [Sphingomonas canadensis]MCW3836176.1 peptidylprolyl isomerase [Sphingomonas canadensis]
MRRRSILFSLAALLALGAAPPAGQQTQPIPGMVRVRLVTSEGNIVLALDTRRAPKTTANFLAYVDDGRLNDTLFYRAAKRTGAPRFGFIQGGIGTDYRRMLPPVKLEPTSQTGIRHTDGVISMARSANPDSGTGNFSLLIGPNPALDAKPGNPGYAAFGRIIAGMDVAKRILAKPVGGGRGAMKGQMILAPVKILRAERLDGRPQPTRGPKPWLIGR